MRVPFDLFNTNYLRMKKPYKSKKYRLEGWNYSDPGSYFITLVTFQRECIFGGIKDQKMFLSPIGEIIKEEWLKSFEIREELVCDSWVIMPNHIHAILKIIRKESQPDKDKTGINPGIAYRPPRSVSSFVAGFKSAATKRINQFRNTPGKKLWQDRFHDRIIKDLDGYQTIHNYIQNNPFTWNDDRFHCK